MSRRAPCRRVAVDAHVLTGMYQGSRTYLENMLRNLGELDGSNRYQIFSHDPATTRALLPFDNFEHYRIPRLGAATRLLAWWPQARRTHKFDVLITQYICPPLMQGSQFVVLHDILPETHPALFPPLMRWRSRLLFRASAQRAEQIFTVSDYTRRQIIARYGVATEKVHITYNGFDAAPAAASRGGKLPAAPYFLYVGRLEKRKNVDLLIGALARAGAAREARLLIVGQRHSASPALLKLIEQSPNVEHRENVDNDELDMLYRGARAFVYPSSAEGFGLPVLEALARGVPVITSDRTSLPEVGGDLVRYFDPTAVGAVERLASILDEAWVHPQPPDRDRLQRHLGQFSWRSSATVLLEQINRLPLTQR